jgi:hypothetical protein
MMVDRNTKKKIRSRLQDARTEEKKKNCARVVDPHIEDKTKWLVGKSI